MTGFVWEEEINGVINGVKTGDGIYSNAQEEKIENIKIELVEKLKDTNNNEAEYTHASIYSGAEEYAYIDNSGQVQTRKINREEGGYLFNEIIPGDYIIRFTYGEEGESIYYNAQDYKSTTSKGIEVQNASDAIDNKPRRKEIMEQTKIVGNSIATVLADSSINIERYKELASIYADTKDIEVSIEYDNAKNGSLDLGLVRRPQTKIELTKEITNIELVNDGIKLIDLKNGITNGMSRTKDLKKDIYRNYFVYMDDELIHGAELNITYKIVVGNVGDIDNLANYFDYDPEYGTKEEQNRSFTTGIDLVYDYTTTMSFLKEKNPQWEIITEYGLLSQAVQNYIKANNVTVVGTRALGRGIAPGEKTEVEITLSRVLGVGKKQEQMYLNEAEIVQMRSEAGRRDEEAIPGNHIPNGEGTKERDEWDTDLIITKPTGGNKEKVYYILGISLGGILILGIVLIKKYVLGKKW